MILSCMKSVIPHDKPLHLVRCFRVHRDGLLTSPIFTVPWYTPDMTANCWDNICEVRGHHGLHGFIDRWSNLTPSGIWLAVGHVLGSGQAVISNHCCRVERQVIQSLTLHPECPNETIKKLQERYHGVKFLTPSYGHTMMDFDGTIRDLSTPGQITEYRPNGCVVTILLNKKTNRWKNRIVKYPCGKIIEEIQK